MDLALSARLLDGLLCAGLLATATLALYGAGAVRSVILYLVFGFLMTLAWIRLEAPDLAFAEAAVGTGVTGALLLLLLARLRRGRA